MNKHKFKKRGFLVLSLFTMGCFATILPSCNKDNTVTTDTYTITYQTTPNGLTFVSKPASANTNTITITYSLSSGYSINTSASKITIGGSDVTSSCTFTSTSLTIPSNLVKGNIVINLATSLSEISYSVSFTDDTNLVWNSKPSTCKNTSDYIATYSLTSNYIIDTANCIIKAGDNDITSHTTFIGGTLTIPKKYITGNLQVALKTKADTYTGESTVTSGTVTELSGEDVKTIIKTGLAAVSRVVYIAPDETSNSSEVNVKLTGNYSNTAIYINKAATYNITLDNCYISNTQSTAEGAEQPFLVDKVGGSINLILSGSNAIIDKRIDTSISYSQDACIKSKSPINISGDGSLKVNDLNYYKGINGKGIQTTKNSNLTIKSGTIDVFARDEAIQAAGKIDISGGSIIANSYQNDGMKTKFDDPTDDLENGGSGNILRDINITGGDVTIYSATNGINAAHDVNISNNSIVNIFTSKSNADDKVSDVSLSEQDMYIAVPSSAIDYSDIENKFFTVTYSSSDASVTSVEYMTLKKIKTINNQTNGGPGPQPGPGGGGGLLGTYYYFKCDRPLDSQYTNFIIKEYDINQYGLKESKMSPNASSSSLSISNPASTNTKDTVVISSISGDTITTKASTFDSNYKSNVGQNESIDSIVGSKGIKARNEVNINGGETNIKSGDTGIQAGYGSIYFNSSTLGDVTLSSGKVNVTAGSINISSSNGDGIKSYSEYTISGGSVKVSKAIEALEAGVININGGTTVLYASDDGVNASEVGKYKVDYVGININSGILDVQTTSSNDTDAIDSNNGITINGGLVIARVPGSNPSSAIDCETKSLVMSGNATVVTLGAIEPTISGYSKNGTHSGNSGGTHTITYNGSSTYTYSNNTTMNSSGKWYSFNNVSIS